MARPDIGAVTYRHFMNNVYVCEPVRLVQVLHAPLLKNYPGRFDVLEVLSLQAEALFEGHAAGDQAVVVQLSNWHPNLIGKAQAAIMGSSLSMEDAQLTVSREHGFENWESVKGNNAPLDPRFEEAVQFALEGQEEELGKALEATPALARGHSSYGHKATLLHYMAANGIETWRQQVPENAAQIMHLLIQAGADTSATMPVYGGAFDALALLTSSAHPQDAGQLPAMEAILKEALLK